MYVHNVGGTGSYTTSTTNMYNNDRFHVRKVFFFRITKEGSFSSTLAANTSRQQQHKAYRKGLGHLLLSLVTVLLLGRNIISRCTMYHVRRKKKKYLLLRRMLPPREWSICISTRLLLLKQPQNTRSPDLFTTRRWLEVCF